MGTILLIALGAIVLRVWYELHQAAIVRRNMSPQMRAAVDQASERRKARIMEAGRLEYEEYKKRHPVLGAFRKYDPMYYYGKHSMDFSRFPL